MQLPQKRNGTDIIRKNPVRFSPDSSVIDSSVPAWIDTIERMAVGSMSLVGSFFALSGSMLVIALPTPVPNRARETATKE